MISTIGGFHYEPGSIDLEDLHIGKTEIDELLVYLENH
jgi:hypothetical protein